jgi:hypothetical protein
MISGYTGGADVLELDAQITQDGHLVVSHDGTVERLTGQPGTIAQMTLAQLRKLDFSETFRPRDSPDFHYYDPEKQDRRLAVETLPDLLDVLPEDVDLLLELKHDSSLATGRRDEFVGKSLDCLRERGLFARTVLYSKDPENLRLARRLEPSLRICVFDFSATADARLELLRSVGADGLVTDLEGVVGMDGKPTAFGKELEATCKELRLGVGAVLYPSRKPGLFQPAELEALRRMEFVWSVSTDSMIDAQAMSIRPKVRLVDTDFAGTKVDTRTIFLGYAKANRHCEVKQDDGIHVVISDYVEPDPPPTSSALERRVLRLEEDLVNAAKEWPYYSGGGLGVVRGLRGDFVAEVEYAVKKVGQATTLEMAVLNVDPGAHQAEPPTSFRGKDSFYDPHGAPPYVGVEHDEDDGYRINWNFGSEYDSNQYGKPVGDGRKPLAGRLRLERRGAFFSAYYRNEVDARDWVCVGTVRNESLNRVVYLRCVGKRWRQEVEGSSPLKYHEILANHFEFGRLTITTYN